MYIIYHISYIWDLLEWFMYCDPASPIMTVSQRKDQDIQAIRLNISADFQSVLESLRSILENECLHEIDEISNESEGKQAKSKSFFFSCSFLWAATRRYGPNLE